MRYFCVICIVAVLLTGCGYAQAMEKQNALQSGEQGSRERKEMSSNTGRLNEIFYTTDAGNKG